MRNNNRLSNIECLRCVAMFFIVLNHCILNVATKKISWDTDPINFCLIDFLYQIVYIGVNLFVFISGYFLIKTTQRKTNWNKILQLWLIVFFYSVSIFLLEVFASGKNFDLQTLIYYLMPIRYDQYWFVTQYIGLFVISPFLAKWACVMTQKEYKAMIVSFFILTSLIQLQGLKGGFSLIWFIFLFMFAGYIRLYEKESICLKKWSEKALTIFIVVSFLLFLLSFPMNRGNLNIVGYFGFYNGPLLFVSSVSVFLLFKKIPESKIVYYIAKLSPYMFGVYLIHEHPVVKEYLWKFVNDQFLTIKIYDLFFVALIIMLFCMLIEYVRQLLFRILRINDVFHIIISSLFVFVLKFLKNCFRYGRIFKKENC